MKPVKKAPKGWLIIVILAIHVDCSGVILNVSFGFSDGFRPVNADIKMVEKDIANPNSTIKRFLAEHARICGR